MIDPLRFIAVFLIGLSALGVLALILFVLIPYVWEQLRIRWRRALASVVPLWVLVFFLFGAAVASMSLGLLVDNSRLADTLVSLGVEIFGAGVLSLVLGLYISRQEQRQEEERRLREEAEHLLEQRTLFISMMGSSDNETALRGVAELEARGWLTDGSLNESRLGYRLNLKGANLSTVILKGAKLQGVNLSGALLRLAQILDATDLRGALLQNSDLRGAMMPGVILQDANLQNALIGGHTASRERHMQEPIQQTLPRTDLTNAQLQRANLREAALGHVHLETANLQGADLRGADLQRARLKKAHLQGADFRSIDKPSRPGSGRTNLSDAEMYKVDLTNAKMQGALMQDVDLRNSILRNVNFEGAELNRVQLQGADLTGANLKGVIHFHPEGAFDGNTILPNGERFRPGIDTNLDIDRFLHPKHKNFWRSPDPASPAFEENANDDPAKAD